MVWDVVAFEASSFIVFVPLRLILKANGSMVLVEKSDPGFHSGKPVTEEWVSHSLSNGSFRIPKDPALIGPGLWIASEEGSLVSFPLISEESWRAARAQELVSRFRIPEGSPIQRLEALMSAGALVGLDVPSMMRKFSSGQRPGESVEETFERIKKM